MTRRGLDPIAAGSAPAAAPGHAMLGLQEFIQPSVEFIFQAENAEQKEEDEGDGLETDQDAIRARPGGEPWGATAWITKR